MSEFKECTACNGRGEVGNILDGETRHYCKCSGVEREMPTPPAPVGTLQELHPEFAKVLHENFLELLGDDSLVETTFRQTAKLRMFEMDKCREEFEKQRYWIGLFRTGVDFDVTLGEFGRYISNGTKITDAMDLDSFNEKWESWANSWQHQQAKVCSLEEHVEKLQTTAELLNEAFQHSVAREEELQRQLNTALEDMELESLKLEEGYDGYKDPVDICQSEGIKIAIKILEQLLKKEG